MPWTEAQVDELIANVRRDFARGRFLRNFHSKLREHGVTLEQVEKTIGKRSYIGQYEDEGKTIGFLNPRNNVFVAWGIDNYPTCFKTCFIARPGVRYLLRQPECELIWSPK